MPPAVKIDIVDPFAPKPKPQEPVFAETEAYCGEFGSKRRIKVRAHLASRSVWPCMNPPKERK